MSRSWPIPWPDATRSPDGGPFPDPRPTTPLPDDGPAGEGVDAGSASMACSWPAWREPDVSPAPEPPVPDRRTRTPRPDAGPLAPSPALAAADVRLSVL